MRTSYVTSKRSDDTYLAGSLGRGSNINGGMPKLTEHQWVNVQISWHNSTSPTTVKFLVAPGGGPYQGVSYNNLATLTSTSGPYLNTVKLGYHQNGGPLAYNQWDDIYIDNSWARVEIGDQPVYDNCTRREMQIPSQWSNDSITLNVNQGAFKPGTEAYLFAVDANGVPSSGKKIIIGDAITEDTNSPTISQPAAPQNLRIQ
jgi:hypothetical protein